MYIPNHSDFAFIPEQYCNNLKLCLIDKMADNHWKLTLYLYLYKIDPKFLCNITFSVANIYSHLILYSKRPKYSTLMMINSMNVIANVH